MFSLHFLVSLWNYQFGNLKIFFSLQLIVLLYLYSNHILLPLLIPMSWFYCPRKEKRMTQLVSEEYSRKTEQRRERQTRKQMTERQLWRQLRDLAQQLLAQFVPALQTFLPNRVSYMMLSEAQCSLYTWKGILWAFGKIIQIFSIIEPIKLCCRVFFFCMTKRL